MLSCLDGWKIAVQHAMDGRSFILVPSRQVEAVRALLALHHVSHSVDASCGRLNRLALEQVIRLDRGEDSDRVQMLLDLAGSVENGPRNYWAAGWS